MNLMYKIVIAYFLDLIFGDPYCIPHPIVFIGKLIKKLENFYYKIKINKKISGFLMMALAIETRCFCPPDKVMPRSPKMVS